MAELFREGSNEPVQWKQPNSKHCFICGLENECGLQMTFFEHQTGKVYAVYRVPERFQGYPGVVHGGVIAAMLDEIIGRAAMGSDGNSFMITAKLEIRYRQPVPTEKPLQLSGWLTKERGRLTVGRGEIRLPDGSVGAEAEALMVERPEGTPSEEELERLGWKVYPERG